MVDDMTLAQARAINAKMTKGWFVGNCISEGNVPDLRGIRLADAERATMVISRHNAEREQAGSCHFETTVAPADLARTFAWMIVNGAGNDGVLDSV